MFLVINTIKKGTIIIHAQMFLFEILFSPFFHTACISFLPFFLHCSIFVCLRALVAQSPFMSNILGFSLSLWTHVKLVGHSRTESRGFSPGTPVFSNWRRCGLELAPQ